MQTDFVGIGIHRHNGIASVRVLVVAISTHAGQPDRNTFLTAGAKETHHQLSLSALPVLIGPHIPQNGIAQEQVRCIQPDPYPGPVLRLQRYIAAPPGSRLKLFGVGIHIKFHIVIAAEIKVPQEYAVVIAGQNKLHGTVVIPVAHIRIPFHPGIPRAQTLQIKIIGPEHHIFRAVKRLDYILPVQQLKTQLIRQLAVDGEIIQDPSLRRTVRVQVNGISLHIAVLIRGTVLRGQLHRPEGARLHGGNPVLSAFFAALPHKPQGQPPHIGLSLMVTVGAEIIARAVLQIHILIRQLNPHPCPDPRLQHGISQPIRTGQGIFLMGQNPEIHIVIAGEVKHVQEHRRVPLFDRHTDRSLVCSMRNAVVKDYFISVGVNG